MGFGQVQMVLGPLLQAKLETTAASAATATGLILTLVAGAMILVQAFVMPRLSLDHRGSVALGAGLLALGALIVFAGSGFAPVAVGLVIGGVGIALASPGYLAWLVSRLSAGEQGAATGWLASAHVLGQGAGAFVGGYTFTLWQPLPLISCAGLAVVVAGAVLAMKPSDG